MRVLSLIIIAGITACCTLPLSAEIYRHVDAEGNVTFTDEPPKGAQEVEEVVLPPGPSPESIRGTEKRNQEILRAADKAEKKRWDEKRKRDATIAQAEKQLEEAEKRLEEAKVIQDEDRQNLAGGKRRIHPDYFARVKAAKEEVAKARKALREARGY
jgi:small-conductance mechanosensitive channel